MAHDEDYSARPLPTLGHWSVWVSGGRVNDDKTKTAFVEWPDTWDLVVPKRFVLLTERAYADLTKSIPSTP